MVRTCWCSPGVFLLVNPLKRYLKFQELLGSILVSPGLSGQIVHVGASKYQFNLFHEQACISKYFQLISLIFRFQILSQISARMSQQSFAGELACSSYPRKSYSAKLKS